MGTGLNKSCRISIVNGRLAIERFHMNNELNPAIVEKLQKSLGLPRCFSIVDLYGKRALPLPIPSEKLFNCSTTRLEMTLTEF